MAKLCPQPCNGCKAVMLAAGLLCTCSRNIWVSSKHNASDLSRTEKEHIMAAIETSRPAPFGAITTYRAVNALTSVFGALGAWNDTRITRKALGKLSDRELDDIGLCRGDIEMLGR